MSCFVSQSLSLDAAKRNLGAVGIAIAKLNARVLPKIKFGQIAVKMLGIDVLVNADDAALEYAEKPFKRVRMHVAACPFKLGMVNGFMLRGARIFVDWRAVANQAAALVQMLVQARADAAMVKRDGTDIAAALDKAKDFDALATRALAGMARPAHFGFVYFNRHAFAAHRGILSGVHGLADTMPKEPCGFHAALEHPLNLPSRDAFLRAAKQVNDLKPQVKRQVAILEQRAHAHREGLFAGVALVQPRTGRLAVQAANARRFPAMRTHRAIRPKPRLDVCKRGRLIEKLRGIQDRLSHGEVSYA
jgi:hypothetical protein